MANEKKGFGGLGGLVEKLGGQIQQYLKGVNFPSNKNMLIEKARANGAPKPIMDILNRFQDRDYKSQEDVEQEAGKFE